MRRRRIISEIVTNQPLYGGSGVWI